MHESTFTYAASLSLLFLAVLLIAVVWPEIDGWHDDWRDYVHESRYGGVCSDPDSTTRPAECDTAPPVELWMFVPWLLAIGTTAAMLVMCWPQTIPVRTRDQEEHP